MPKQSRSYPGPDDPRGRAYYWLAHNDMPQHAVKEYQEALRDKMKRGDTISAEDYAYFIQE